MNRTALVLGAALLAAGCQSKDPMTVVTYNAGLAQGFVKATAYRSPLTADAIVGLDADIVCVQEVWAPGDVATLETAAGSAYPHRYFPEAAPEVLDEVGCDTTDMDRLVGCVENNCDTVCEEELVDCMLANCQFPFLQVDKSCQGCVMANVGGTTAEVRDACDDAYPLYAYGGTFGTGILSKHPFVGDVEEYVFDSTTNRRSVLHAVVDSPMGKTDVYCTHLTAIFAVLPYPRESGDWDREQRNQIDDMLSWIDDTATTDQIVLMGDMNTGPAGDDFEGEYPEHYQKFLDAGFADPYVEQIGDCTYCAANPLNDPTGGDGILDHAFVKGMDGAHTASRVLDGSLDGMDYCDGTLDGAYSDHYGVSVTINP